MGGKRAEPPGKANTWAVTAAVASGTFGWCRWAGIMNYSTWKSPLGSRLAVGKSLGVSSLGFHHSHNKFWLSGRAGV